MAKDRSEYDKKYEEKRAGQRTRNWLVIFYPDDLPEDWKEQVDQLQCRWIESPLHDKDFNPDGTPKKIHYHTLFMFDSIKNHEQMILMLKGVFGESETGSIIGVALPLPASDRCGSVRYMAHLDHPRKAQYDVTDIVGHNGADPAEILRYSITETLEKMIAIEEFIEENNITEYQQLCKRVRYEHLDWYQIITTKNTLHFSRFVNSLRGQFDQPAKIIRVNEQGEVIE